MPPLEHKQISLPLKALCPDVTCFEIPKVPQGAPRLIHIEQAGHNPVWSTHPLPEDHVQLAKLIRNINKEIL